MANFGNITQVSTDNATDFDVAGWKTNLFYIDSAIAKRISYTQPTSGSATRVTCDASSTNNNKVQTYSFNNYSIS